MLEIFVVAVVVAATARTARGRGASSWLYGSVALVGFVLFKFGLATLVAAPLVSGQRPSSGAIIGFRLIATLLPYLWLGALYLYVRTVPGRSHAQPLGQWRCPECRWLNAATVFKCEACGHEFQPSAT